MSEANAVLLAKSTAAIGADRYHVSISVGHHALVADEPIHSGGGDTGTTPLGMLLSALGACTSITLKMYAERKGWPLTALTVDLKYFKSDETARIERLITVSGPLDQAQRARLADIAERTPVTLVIKNGVPIATELQPNGN